MRIFKNKHISEVLFLIIGSVLYALSVNLFLDPGEIAVGGFTGISQILNRLFHTPIGIVIIVLNIPMILLCAKYFGIAFVSKTLIAIGSTSVLIDLLSFLPSVTDDKLLNALFGGVVMGMGIGLLFQKGFTTGGSDLVAWLLKLRFRNMSTGILIFMVDGLVITSYAVIFQDYNEILYSVIAVFSCTKVIDVITGMTGGAKLAYIICNNYEQVADNIISRLERGVTLLEGVGWYTKERRRVLMCVIGRTAVYELKDIVSEADPRAFIIFSDASEVVGEGFATHAVRKKTEARSKKGT
ncbi:MAG: YitT family protein [Eubacteriales bacterium]